MPVLSTPHVTPQGQLIETLKPLSPLPVNNGWLADGSGFDWALVERNFSFVMMGRMVTGSEVGYGLPLTQDQMETLLGHQPEPLAQQLHDLLWALRHQLKADVSAEQSTESSREAVALLEQQVHAQKRLIWAATFTPLPVVAAPKEAVAGVQHSLWSTL